MRSLILFAALLSVRDYKLEEREPVRHVFQSGSVLDIDAVSGSVTVTADDVPTIRVEGERIARAAETSQLALAKKEVTLDINQKDGVARLYVNGPFRDNHGFHDHAPREYEVIYNLTIRVPRAAELRIRTVNGDVKVADTNGHFDIHGVNGGITMTNVAGSGTVVTLNGPTAVTFRENPKADSLFKSFNGRVDIAFRPGLSADLRLKTFNGQAYTDFDVTPLASQPAAAERKDDRFVYRSGDTRSVRAGTGGPLLRFETFNGKIQIRRQN